jgi:hypothetical protein
MKKALLLLCCLGLLWSAETSLGGISLGDSFDKVIEKYPAVGEWKYSGKSSLPFPLTLDDERQYRFIQAKELYIQFYCDDHKNVKAITVFQNLSGPKDKTVYETGAGLRLLDSVIELKLLYGIPQDISEFNYRDLDGTQVTRRIYYYPNLCVQTKRYNRLPEYIELIVLGQYNMHSVLQKKDVNLHRKL